MTTEASTYAHERLAALEGEAAALRAKLAPEPKQTVTATPAIPPDLLKLTKPVVLDRSKIVMGHMKLMREVATAGRALNAANQNGDVQAIESANKQFVDFMDSLTDFMSAIVVGFDDMPVVEFWAIVAEVTRQMNESPSPN